MSVTCRFCHTPGLNWRNTPDGSRLFNVQNQMHYMCDAMVKAIEEEKKVKAALGETGTSGFKLPSTGPALNPEAAPDVIWASQVLNAVAQSQETAQKALDASLAAMQEFGIKSQEVGTAVKDVQAHFKATDELVANVKQEFGKALATIDQKKQVEITVKTESTQVTLTERMHEKFPHLIKLMPIARRSGQIVFLTGEPSSGKTAAIAYAAKAMGVPFWTQSMTMLTSISDIEGFVSGHGNYVESPLWQACRPDGVGGIVLLDEIDASNANALIGLNSYGANEWVTFPNGMTFQKHPKAYIVAAGNTIGSGADTRFVGRNELDMATRDRFTYLQWDIDWGLVAHIATQKMGEDTWARKCKVIHDSVEKHRFEWVASARLVFFGIEAFQDGYTEAEVLDMKLWPHLSDDERRLVEKDLVNADVAIHETKIETPWDDKGENLHTLSYDAQVALDKLTIVQIDGVMSYKHVPIEALGRLRNYIPGFSNAVYVEILGLWGIG